MRETVTVSTTTTMANVLQSDGTAALHSALRKTDPLLWGKDEALELLRNAGGLERIASAFPNQISSGMQRRVEILRALINQPKVLLLDEPFRAMDTVSKSKMA